MTNKEQYIKYCEKALDISIFSQPWWLDIVCENTTWDVALVKEGDTIIASMPYQIQKKYGLTFSLMPAYTQYLGPSIRYKQSQSYTKRLAYDKKTIQELLDQLPKIHRFEQSLNPYMQNWLPFFWNAYKQNSCFTYILDDISDVEETYKNFSSNIRRAIKKAQKTLSVTKINEVDEFIALIDKSGKGSKIMKDERRNMVRNIIVNSIERERGTLLIAKDENENIHAGAFFLEDHNMFHYIMGAANSEFRSSGASSLLMWSAIKLFSQANKKFNFEGSMVESIEKYFRSFGAQQLSYSKLSKINSRLLKIKLALQ